MFWTWIFTPKVCYGKKKKQLTLSTLNAFPRRAYWISDAVGGKRGTGVVGGNGDSMVFLRGKK